MSAPVKPWESAGFSNNRNLQSSSTMQNILTTPVGRMRMTPPVPPRPNSGTGASGYNGGYNTNSYSAYNRGIGYSPYNSYGSYGGVMGGYGGYSGMSSMGGMGGYGSYGGYGNSYGGYGNPMGGFGPESSFIQLAEESTRPAFQNIESVVRAFSSISMMMDSTFFAITSSFRAVLGIAENFGRLRSMFGQIWSSFALFRLLNWIYRKVLTTIGLKKASDFGSMAWEQAVEGTVTEVVPKGASWPIFVFLGIIISAPYLISKMIPPIDGNRRDPTNWPSPGMPVRVLYEFKASSPQELSISPGETIRVAPKSIQEEMQLPSTGWVYVTSNRGVGIVPRNYLQPPTKRTNTENVPSVSSFVPETIPESNLEENSEEIL